MQRLLTAQMWKQSFTGEDIARVVIDLIHKNFALDCSRIAFSIRDGCSTNTKAVRKFSFMFPNNMDVICTSHSACLAGDKLCHGHKVRFSLVNNDESK